MPEVIVVGAGLAGLTASIQCARAGHEVRVLERFNRVGGAHGHHPSVDSTPLLPERMGKLLGFELKPPQVTPTSLLRSFVYGRDYVMDGKRQSLQAVERGSRSTSLENYLFRIAQDAGVKFDFGWTLRTQNDVAELPPGSIVATGLHYEPYQALGIPWQDVYGFVANGRFEGPPMAVVWFDTFAGDYSYFANLNGIGFALAFDRKPLPRIAQERFVRRLYQDLGVEFEGWHSFEGAVGVKRLDNPRLFSGPLILAGSLAGMQDPFFFFGVHASLISGSIAAMAVDDKAAAWERFRRISALYKYSFVGRRLFEPLPHPVRKPLLCAFMKMQVRWPDRFGGLTLNAIPGFKELERSSLT